MKKRTAFVLKRILPVLLALLMFASAGTGQNTALAYTDLPFCESYVRQQNAISSIYEADISTLREMLDSGEITCVQLTQFYLDRIEAYNKTYNCFITMCDDALEQAAEKDRLMAEGKAEGALFGIPMVIKDNMDLAGYKTSNGYRLSSVSIEKTTADVVKSILDAGAVIIGKTNMSTGAQRADASISQAAGETKNAYSTALSAGGSSGGTAAAVSLNFAAVGLGTDTNSSLRIPSAFNGCTTLRVTHKLISTKGIERLSGYRDVPGVISRSVKDNAIVLDVLTEGEYDYTANLDADCLDGIRIGVLTNLSYAGHYSKSKIDKEIAAAFEQAIADLEAAGATVVEVSFSSVFNYRSQASATNNALTVRSPMYKEFKTILEKNDLDAVIFPTYLSEPVPSGSGVHSFYNNCYYLGPLMGTPELTVQIGKHSKGSGIGMNVAALRNEEQLLLNIGYAYETLYNHRVPTDENAPNLVTSVSGTLPYARAD